MNQFTHPVGRRSATLTGYVQQTSSALPNLNVCPAGLICPGGGYAYCTDREAEPVALAFLNAGYNAFVLRYTVSTSCPGAEVFDKALAEAVERDEIAHAAEHCSAFADGNGKARQQRRHKRLGNAVRHKIAQANIRRKARDDLPIALFIPERVVLIEKIAQYAAEKVV